MKVIILALAIHLILGIHATSAETVVYDEQPLDYPWSGLIGSNLGRSLTISHLNENPQNRETSAKISYNSLIENWTNLFIQCTGDWRRGPGIGLNLADARILSFYAKGLRGGEVVQFGYGYDDPDASGFRDSAYARRMITLEDNWKKYEFDLRRKDLSHINGLFSLRLEKNDNPGKQEVTFYLDNIRYE